MQVNTGWVMDLPSAGAESVTGALAMCSMTTTELSNQNELDMWYNHAYATAVKGSR